MGGVIDRLSESMRVVTFDKRGTGLSDPVDHAPPLDERMDDLHAVMDAAGLDVLRISSAFRREAL